MARETINGISVPIPGTGEPADFVGDLRRIASDLSASTARPLSALRTTFADKADGAIPAAGDDGVTVVPRGGSGGGEHKLVIADGLLQAPGLTGAVGDRGTYWQQELDGIKRIGGVFKLSPGEGVDVANATLALWSYLIPTPFRVPNSPLHLSITKDNWTVMVGEGGDSATNTTFTTIESDPFDVPLAADWDPETPGTGTAHRIEVILDGDTCTLLLPDRRIVTLTDARFASIDGNVAVAEPYRGSGAAGHSAFESFWASNDVATGPATSPGETALVVRKAVGANSGAAWAPTIQHHSPGSAGDVSVPNGVWEDVHANLSVTFTLPDDCITVEVELNGFLTTSAAVAVLWGVYEGATARSSKAVLTSPATPAVNQLVTSKHRITSLIPGSTYTFNWKHRGNATGASLKAGPGGFQPTIVVSPTL